MATVSERLQCSTYHRLETTKAARACLGSVECRMQRGLSILGKAHLR